MRDAGGQPADGSQLVRLIDHVAGLGEPRRHLIEGRGELAELVAARHRHAMGEISGGDPLGRRQQRAHRLADPAVEQAGEQQTDRRDAGDRQQERGTPAFGYREVDIGERERDVEDAEHLLLGRVRVATGVGADRLVGDRSDDAEMPIAGLVAEDAGSAPGRELGDRSAGGMTAVTGLALLIDTGADELRHPASR